MSDDDQIIYILGEIRSDVKGINQRLDKVNGRLDKHDEKIQVLETRNSMQDGSKKTLAWILNLLYGAIGIVAGLFGSWLQTRR